MKKKKCTFDSRRQLKSAIILFVTDPRACERKFGHPKKWDVSNIRSFKGLFSHLDIVDFPGIEHWTTVQVTDMSELFKKSYKFNSQRLRGWNTKNVTTFEKAFHMCRRFECDLNQWDTSQATNMKEMFRGAVEFTGSGLERWNVEKVVNMCGMFRDCQKLRANLSLWNTTSLQTVQCMFWGCSIFNGDISNWITSNIIDAQGCFVNARDFNQDLKRWNTSRVQAFNCMFMGAISFEGHGISNWDYHKNADLRCMFRSATSFNEDMSHLNLSQHDTSDMFTNSSITRAPRVNTRILPIDLLSGKRSINIFKGCKNLSTVPMSQDADISRVSFEGCDNLEALKKKMESLGMRTRSIGDYLRWLARSKRDRIALGLVLNRRGIGNIDTKIHITLFF